MEKLQYPSLLAFLWRYTPNLANLKWHLMLLEKLLPCQQICQRVFRKLLQRQLPAD
jgi:hypothetical protein